MAAIFFLLFCLPFLYGCGWAAMFVRVRDKCTFHYDNDNNNTSTEERKKGERKKKKKKTSFWPNGRCGECGVTDWATAGVHSWWICTHRPRCTFQDSFSVIYIYTRPHKHADGSGSTSANFCRSVHPTLCLSASERMDFFCCVFHMKHMPGYRDR